MIDINMKTYFLKKIFDLKIIIIKLDKIFFIMLTSDTLHFLVDHQTLSSLTFNVTRRQSIKDHIFFTVLRKF